jgi:hypothetical protein
VQRYDKFEKEAYLYVTYTFDFVSYPKKLHFFHKKTPI